MKMRPLLVFAATVAGSLPTVAFCDDASDLRQQILQGCNLKAWQFNVRIERGGAIMPQISPTMIPGQRKCVLTMIDTFRRDQGAN